MLGCQVNMIWPIPSLHLHTQWTSLLSCSSTRKSFRALTVSIPRRRPSVPPAAVPFLLVSDLELSEIASHFLQIEEHSQEKRNEAGTMIYRKWSLLTGPAAILGGIVATTVVANFIFIQNDPFFKSDQKKSDAVSSTN